MGNPRFLALRVLISVDENKSYANLALSNLQTDSLSGVDKALLIQLVYGTVSQQLALDYQLNRLLKKPVDTLTVPMRNILRLGAYQIMFLNKVPARAAVDESVKLAHKFGHRGTVSLVNAVLRRLSEVQVFSWPDPSLDIAAYLSTRYSHPYFLVKRYIARVGSEATEKILMANNRPPRLSVRVNTLITSVAALKERFEEKGMQVQLGEFVPEILYPSPTPSFADALFTGGQYIVQGETSAMCAHFLGPRANERVVDLCAAPGGKTTHIAELMGDKGEVIAFDINPKRLQLVTENAQRLGLRSISVQAKPAQEAERVVGRVDRVLLDAPCSGFGVLRHKPDMRWHRSESDIGELAKLQRELITRAADLVKPGGTLVYSVCTTEPEETTEIIKHFLGSHQDFVVDSPPSLKRPLDQSEPLGYFFWPHLYDIDGFYIVGLRRAGN